MGEVCTQAEHCNDTAKSITTSLPSVPLLLSISRKAQGRGSPRGLPGTAAPPGNPLVCQSSGPTPHPLNQKLGVQSSRLCFRQPSHDSEAHSSVRSPVQSFRSPGLHVVAPPFTSCA